MFNRRQFIQRCGMAFASFGYLPSWNAKCERLVSVQRDTVPKRRDTSPHSHLGQFSMDRPDYSSTGVQLLEDSHPLDDGFYFPAEWHPHEATLMALPPPQNWQGAGFSMRDVRQQWADVANAIANFEPVILVVRPEDRKRAERLVSKEIELLELPLNDGWTRDTGPMFVINQQGEKRVAGCTFNGWGNKFDDAHEEDALLKARVGKHFDLPFYPIDLVLEGGAVHFDGEGTILTTAECLQNKNRNPDLSPAEIETKLHQAFGTQKVIWLDRGLTPDPITDGHIDGIAAFVDVGVVLLHSVEDRLDPNFEICRDAKRVLTETTDAKGRRFEIIDLPLTENGGHMNFYLGNGCVIIPTVGIAREDDQPLGILREVFPDREIVGISGDILADGGGGIHCITQQIPQ